MHNRDARNLSPENQFTHTPPFLMAGIFFLRFPPVAEYLFKEGTFERYDERQETRTQPGILP